ncbi:MAG TPA: hypothetical protein VHP56_08120 [Solirubrobacterales bacterium]|nr:hypothetical protein [Solirubrobacterales bacterium]
MSRLRHPIRAIREPFGTAGLIVAMVALVAALGGTALAAKGALTGKQKKEVEKIAMRFQGSGPAGPAGSKGDPGVPGADGKNASGTPGTAGEPGKSVVAAEIPAEPAEETCGGEGGAEYEIEESEEPTVICNGHQGKDGSPWTVGTLPPGAVETGTYSVKGGVQKVTTEYTVGEPGEEEVKREDVFVGEELGFASISFPVPLVAPLIAEDSAEPPHAHVFYGKGTGSEEDPAEFTEHCPAKNATFPAVKNPGDVCIYRAVGTSGNATFEGLFRTAGTMGTTIGGGFLRFSFGEEPGRAIGSFAVKGCSLEEGPMKCPE